MNTNFDKQFWQTVKSEFQSEEYFALCFGSKLFGLHYQNPQFSEYALSMARLFIADKNITIFTPGKESAFLFDLKGSYVYSKRIKLRREIRLQFLDYMIERAD